MYSSFTFSHNNNPLIGNLIHNNSNGVNNEKKEWKEKKINYNSQKKHTFFVVVPNTISDIWVNSLRIREVKLGEIVLD
jgi:hypothetical protein